MTLEIISSHDIVFKGQADAVSLPGLMGRFMVLKNHAPLISVLTEGTIAYQTPGGEEMSYDIKGGLADVENNVISVCIY